MGTLPPSSRSSWGLSWLTFNRCALRTCVDGSFKGELIETTPATGSPEAMSKAAAVPPPIHAWTARAAYSLSELATMNSAKTIDTIDTSLINMFSDGPAVSLNGSPTVSPTTAALWAEDPFPP